MTNKEAADTIRSIGRSLIDLAAFFEGEQKAPKEAKPPAETKAPAAEEKPISFTEVRAVLSDISRSGHTEEMKALLGRFGAVKLSDVKQEDYGALLAAAKEVRDAGRSQ